MHMNYFLGDRFILKSCYRFFMDNRGVRSHTVSLEAFLKITPFVSLSPFTAITNKQPRTLFAASGAHTAADQYYTSDHAYAAFSSQFAGLNLRITPPNGGLGTKGFSAPEIRYGHQGQTTGLAANNPSLNLTFK